MTVLRRFRISAVVCALALLLCELVSKPYAEMGICDDWTYFLTAQKLAITGHVLYNGWVNAIVGWQLFYGAAFIKLFGATYTAVRSTTLLVAMATAFFTQRSLVRSGISERNATIGTLALVLSPIYLMLSVTFMTDIPGMFALVLCFYCCLRVLQAPSARATIGWLWTAAITNAVFGTSRQIAWLGVLVIVPSTLWLLRSQRRVLLAGLAAFFAGVAIVFGCMHWFSQQPYTLPQHIKLHIVPYSHMLGGMAVLYLLVPFFLLPVFTMFLPGIGRKRLILAVLIALASLVCASLLVHYDAFNVQKGDWMGIHGMYENPNIKGQLPVFVTPPYQILLAAASFAGLLSFLAAFALPSTRLAATSSSSNTISWRQLGILLGPFAAAYTFLLLPRAGIGLFDRYLLGLLAFLLVCILRVYQERIQPQLPLTSLLLVAAMAVYGVAVTHNMFSFYRARIALAAEIRAAGVPDTSVDNGWEYNGVVELQHAWHINDDTIEFPAHSFVPVPPLPANACYIYWYADTPHIQPIYNISSDPNACAGPAGFAPVTYSRWLASAPGVLYVVRYLPLGSPESLCFTQKIGCPATQKTLDTPYAPR